MAGTCVALVSGGIDSPVAVARMLMQGWKIYPVHASQEPITGPEGEQKAIAALKHLLELDGPLGNAARENLVRKITVVPVADVDHRQRASLLRLPLGWLLHEDLHAVSDRLIGPLFSTEQAAENGYRGHARELFREGIGIWIAAGEA